MSDENRDRDEFQEFLRKFFSSAENFNPEDLAKQAGIPIDPANLGMMMEQLQRAISGQGEGINWKLVETQAKKSSPLRKLNCLINWSNRSIRPSVPQHFGWMKLPVLGNMNTTL